MPCTLPCYLCLCPVVRPRRRGHGHFVPGFRARLRHPRARLQLRAQEHAVTHTPFAASVDSCSVSSGLFVVRSVRSGSLGYSEPYRLFNLDVFEYELDVPMALYGAGPLSSAGFVCCALVVFSCSADRSTDEEAGCASSGFQSLPCAVPAACSFQAHDRSDLIAFVSPSQCR